MESLKDEFLLSSFDSRPTNKVHSRTLQGKSDQIVRTIASQCSNVHEICPNWVLWGASWHFYPGSYMHTSNGSPVALGYFQILIKQYILITFNFGMGTGRRKIVHCQNFICCRIICFIQILEFLYIYFYVTCGCITGFTNKIMINSRFCLRNWS